MARLFSEVFVIHTTKKCEGPLGQKIAPQTCSCWPKCWPCWLKQKRLRHICCEPIISLTFMIATELLRTFLWYCVAVKIDVKLEILVTQPRFLINLTIFTCVVVPSGAASTVIPVGAIISRALCWFVQSAGNVILPVCGR